MFNIAVDHNLIAIIAQFLFFVWFLSGLNQRVKDLEREFAESKASDKEIKDDLHALSLVVARSDEKLVQLVARRHYGRLETDDSDISIKPKRRRKQAIEAS